MTDLTRVTPVPVAVGAPDMPVGYVGRRRRGVVCAHLWESGAPIADDRIPAVLRWHKTSKHTPALRCSVSGLVMAVEWANDICCSSHARGCAMAEGTLR